MPLLAWLLVKTARINHRLHLVKLHLPQSVLQGHFHKRCYKWGIPQWSPCLTIAKGQHRDKVSIHKAGDFTASVSSSHLFETYLCFLMGIVTTSSSSSSLLAGRKAPLFWIKNLAMTLTAALCCCFPASFESHTWKRGLLHTDSKSCVEWTGNGQGTNRNPKVTLDGSESISSHLDTRAKLVAPKLEPVMRTTIHGGIVTSCGKTGKWHTNSYQF